MADRTGLRLIVSNTREKAAYHLFYTDTDQVLTLRDNTVTPPVEISIDFCAGRNRHRQLFGGGLGQPLARAVNIRKLRQTDYVICDATGGFGSDALVFASLGCQVVLLERSQIVFELLSDAIARGLSDTDTAEIAERMSVYHADSTHLPANWPGSTLPHTVYLDPMYPHRSGKTGHARKGMQTLKRLLDTDTQSRELNDERLLNAALKSATHRVVVKRPKGALPIKGPVPVGSIKSANTRYDIYHPC